MIIILATFATDDFDLNVFSLVIGAFLKPKVCHLVTLPTSVCSWGEISRVRIFLFAMSLFGCLLSGVAIADAVYKLTEISVWFFFIIYGRKERKLRRIYGIHKNI